MLHRLFQTPNDYAILVIRITLAGMMWAHGAQKFLGWFGGHGFQGTMQFFTQGLGIPAPLGVLAILTEFFGMIALFLGFFGRVMAAGAAAILVMAVLTVHHKFGFYMNWYGQNQGEGFELHLLGIAMAVAVMIRGSGALSIDRLIARGGRRG